MPVAGDGARGGRAGSLTAGPCAARRGRAAGGPSAQTGMRAARGNHGGDGGRDETAQQGISAKAGPGQTPERK